MAVLLPRLGSVEGFVGGHVVEQCAQLLEGRQGFARQHFVHLDSCAQCAVGEAAAQSFGAFCDGLDAFDDQLAILHFLVDAVEAMAVQILDARDLVEQLVGLLQVGESQRLILPTILILQGE